MTLSGYFVSKSICDLQGCRAHTLVLAGLSCSARFRGHAIFFWRWIQLLWTLYTGEDIDKLKDGNSEVTFEADKELVQVLFVVSGNP